MAIWRLRKRPAAPAEQKAGKAMMRGGLKAKRVAAENSVSDTVAYVNQKRETYGDASPPGSDGTEWRLLASAGK